MHTSLQELSRTYRNLPDADIAALHAEADQLTGEALSALTAEIERRGLSSAHLEKLHSSELHRETNFDRREKWRRNSTLSYLLFRNDLKGTLLIFGALILLILITEVVRHYK